MGFEFQGIVENIEFVDADPCVTLSSQVGLFQVAILPNSLNGLSDPEHLLERIHYFVDVDGLLIISTDYNWKRHTNRVCTIMLYCIM